MKKLLVYHIVTITPIVLILALYIYEAIGTGLFALSFLVYAFVFRPIIDFQRLRQKGLVSKEDFWKSFGFVRFKYYYQLMFEE